VDVIALLKQLSEAEGIAGSEGPVREVVRGVWQPLVSDLRADRLGNLIALKHGSASEPRPKLMVAAHMDEIGLRVTGVEKGFLRIGGVGGADIRVLLGREVIVHGRRDLPGVVAARPPHVLTTSERNRAVAWDKLFVDVGLPADEVAALVSVGDLISFRCELTTLKNHRVAGKALDDRASVAAVTLALEQLANVQHACDVLAVATVQEESGLIGATTAAFGIAPDAAIVLDVTFGAQPGVAESEAFPLGGGPTIGVGPNFHPRLVEALRKTADRLELAYQLEPLPGRSGTDAWAIQVAHEGVPSALISIPLRYMHQPVETLAVQDVERAGRLLAAFIQETGADLRAQLTWPIPAESE
jgi:putative aminopeptidase FrvX